VGIYRREDRAIILKTSSLQEVRLVAGATPVGIIKTAATDAYLRHSTILTPYKERLQYLLYIQSVVRS